MYGYKQLLLQITDRMDTEATDIKASNGNHQRLQEVTDATNLRTLRITDASNGRY